jgi:hypothetical protein
VRQRSKAARQLPLTAGCSSVNQGPSRPRARLRQVGDCGGLDLLVAAATTTPAASDAPSAPKQLRRTDALPLSANGEYKGQRITPLPVLAWWHARVR